MKKSNTLGIEIFFHNEKSLKYPRNTFIPGVGIIPSKKKNIVWNSKTQGTYVKKLHGALPDYKS